MIVASLIDRRDDAFQRIPIFSTCISKTPIFRGEAYLVELVQQTYPEKLISYNNRSYPSVPDFQKLVSKYRDVEVEYKAYENGRGGKGSVAGSSEILLICKKRLTVEPFAKRWSSPSASIGDPVFSAI